MNLKDWIFTILGTAILVALIVLITSLKSNNQSAAILPSNPPTGETSADPMAGHHGGEKPADSTVFNNLVGKTAPDFTLASYSGDLVTLSQLKGKNVILFFNEGLMCYPACWNQIAAFGKDTQFKDKNTVVLNIVVDSKEKWQEAVTKMSDLSAATVLLDVDRKVSSTYGVLNLPSSMHKGQFPGHSYVVIDKNGVVRFANDDTQMAIRNKELLSEISNL